MAPSLRHLLQASMRPRVFPAEDPRGPCGGCPTRRRFNEAAGIPRGRRQPFLDSLSLHIPASMRPRVFPAEDRKYSGSFCANFTGFNEAAGIPRGRLEYLQRALGLWSELQ